MYICTSICHVWIYSSTYASDLVVHATYPFISTDCMCMYVVDSQRVYVYVYVYTCYTYVYVFSRMFIHRYISTSVYLFTCAMHIYYINIYIRYLEVCMYMCVSVVCVGVHMHVCVCVCICVCLHADLPTHLRVLICFLVCSDMHARPHFTNASLYECFNVHVPMTWCLNLHIQYVCDMGMYIYVYHNVYTTPMYLCT